MNRLEAEKIIQAWAADLDVDYGTDLHGSHMAGLFDACEMSDAEYGYDETDYSDYLVYLGDMLFNIGEDWRENPEDKREAEVLWKISDRVDDYVEAVDAAIMKNKELVV